ncbi:hypothetical protein GOB94_06640 [Granulicella sp. 5B5]|uniref:glycoside hydrolase family 2 protein n=1 Tax=Granulicella sp. 5B5 TaxID=1617967 RepID=UPI0015F37C28|nr:glycoside hydrolase family 2 TIM barrel-domain containing protein [Granulicella sp. 5B5]QMV18395.1 hypothetical protein GOB94_06640 [Granulicella sp. 5B5]
MRPVRFFKYLTLVLAVGFYKVPLRGQSANDLHFVRPEKPELQGTVDLEVVAPADTTNVRFYLDNTQLSELTDEYAIATKAKPIWHTVMGTEYFSPGPHELSAVATTTDGTIRTMMHVNLLGSATPHSINLDGSWHFSAAEELPRGSMDGASPQVIGPGYNDAHWSDVEVPNSIDTVDHRWMHPNGLLGTYRREFTLPHKGEGELYIKSESCFWSCRYFVNGVEVGASAGGYLPRSFRVTPNVHQGVNTLAVIVDSRPSAMGVFQKLRYYYWNYTGLLQNISLEQLPSVGITEFRAQGSADGTLAIYPSVVNSSGHPEDLMANIRVQGPDGHTVLSRSEPIHIPASDGVAQPIKLQLKNVMLWDLEHPNLYTVTITTHPSTGEMKVSEKTGFRDISIRDGDLLLNGHPVLGLQGFDRHGDYPGLGRSQPDGLADREIKMFHDKGFRIFRPAHYPTTKAELDAADKYGLLVLEEINVTGLSGEQLASPATMSFARDQLRRMIVRDRSHPSIFAWSVGNENRTDQSGSEVYVHDTIQYGKTLDPTRPFTEVSAQLRHDICYGEMDFLAVNIYAGWYTDKLTDLVPELDALATYAGNKPMVITEYGAGAVLGRQGTGKGSEYFQALTVDEYNHLLLNRPHFIGKMYWTSTELVVSPKWDGGNPYPASPFHTKGLLTYFRQPKLGWRVMFSPIEMDTIPPITSESTLPFSRQIQVVVRNRTAHQVKGHLLITPPKGSMTATPDLEFSVEPNGKTDLSFELQITQRVKSKNSEGLVRAVVDSETEAMPELLQIQDACASCAK